jgi:hypothetical protein
MAATKPKLALPFDGDEPSLVPILPDGSPFEGNKRQYFDALMGLQHQSAAYAKSSTEIDRECRIEIMKLLYPNSYPVDAMTGRMDGTDKFELPGGWTLEYEKRVGVKVDESQLPGIREAVMALPTDEETGEMATLGDAIRYRAELSDTAYGNLREDVRVLLNEALTFTPGTPGIKAVAPKAKAAARASDQKALPASGFGGPENV